jgi:hypothetical protein
VSMSTFSEEMDKKGTFLDNASLTICSVSYVNYFPFCAHISCFHLRFSELSVHIIIHMLRRRMSGLAMLCRIQTIMSGGDCAAWPCLLQWANIR